MVHWGSVLHYAGSCLWEQPKKDWKSAQKRQGAELSAGSAVISYWILRSQGTLLGSKGDHYLTLNNKALLNLLVPHPQSSLSSPSPDLPCSTTHTHTQSKYKEQANTHYPPVQTCRGLPTAMWFQLQTTWGSDSSPSSSLKRSSAPNFRIAVSSSLLKGFELLEQTRRMCFELLSQHFYNTKSYQRFS